MELMEIAHGVWTAQALATATTLGIADQLAAGPRTCDELAAATGTQPRALYRLLRSLASLGVFAERGDGRFENTPHSTRLRADVPGSMRDFIIMLGQPWHLAAYAQLEHAVRTGKPAFDHALGKSLWQYYAEHPEQSRIFNAAMTNVITETAEAVRDGYDFTGLRTLVDVGGGHGMLLGMVLAANPGLRGVLFDQPHVVEGAGPTLDRLGVRDRVTIAGGDFFAEVPRGDAYVLSHIIHDWDDERSTTILRTIRRAAEPGAHLLVVETVVAPGNDPAFVKILDLEMLAVAGGVERTEAEYRDLLRAGGFRLTRIIPANIPTRTLTHIVEGVPA